MEILSGFCILICMAAFVSWQMEDVLMHLEARIHARRVGIKAQRSDYESRLVTLKEEN